LSGHPYTELCYVNGGAARLHINCLKGFLHDQHGEQSLDFTSVFICWIHAYAYMMVCPDSD